MSKQGEFIVTNMKLFNAVIEALVKALAEYDYIHVTRCKYCKHRNSELFCTNYNRYMADECYCSDAERGEE